MICLGEKQLKMNLNSFHLRRFNDSKSTSFCSLQIFFQIKDTSDKSDSFISKVEKYYEIFKSENYKQCIHPLATLDSIIQHFSLINIPIQSHSLKCCRRNINKENYFPLRFRFEIHETKKLFIEKVFTNTTQSSQDH